MAEQDEKQRRIHWQDLAYEGMRLVDAILGGKVQEGTGTCQETFKQDCEKATRKHRQLVETCRTVLGELRDGYALEARRRLVLAEHEGLLR